MRIVYCINQLEHIGGTERITIAKANALSMINGNDVSIIVAYNRRENDSISINPKVQVVNLDVHYYDDNGNNKLKGLLFYCNKRIEHKNKLEKALNIILPDIVISVGASERQFLAKLKVTSNPVFIREMHFHKYYRRLMAVTHYERLVARIGEFVEYFWNINRYDRIVVLTQEDRDTNWSNNSKVVVIPNPITESPNRVSDLRNKKVITAGRLIKSKNISSLISVWGGIHKKFPDWKLEIYGDGQCRSLLQKVIDDNNLSECVILCGFASNIINKMLDSSIFAFTSKCEGFGLVLVEAMSCGVPVVSYDCPCGPKDIINDGKDGFLIRINDEQSLLEKLSLLMSNDNIRMEMGRNAQERARDFSMDIIISMWMSLFESLLKGDA